MGIKFYDPSKVAVSCNGFSVKDFGPETMVSIEKNDALKTQTVSLTRGTGVYNKTVNFTGVVTFNVLGNSDTFKTLYDDMMKNIDNDTTFTVSVVDSNDGALQAVMTGCAYMDLPKQSKGKEVDVVDIQVMFFDVSYS